MKKITGVRLTTITREGKNWEKVITMHTRKQGDCFRAYLIQKIKIDGKLCFRIVNSNWDTFCTLPKAERIAFLMALHKMEVAKDNGYKTEFICE